MVTIEDSLETELPQPRETVGESALVTIGVNVIALPPGFCRRTLSCAPTAGLPEISRTNGFHSG